jgi:TP901 family phage tail tape measure protein
VSGIKVADLYASLGIQIDEAKLAKADKALQKALHKNQYKMEAFSSSMSIAKFKAFDNVAGRLGMRMGALAGTAAMGAATAGTLALGAGFVYGAKDALDFDKALIRLKISAGGAMGDTSKMRDTFLELSKSTGVAKEELISGAQAYVALTGDGKGAAEAVKTFARVSVAASTPMSDVAGSAGAMAQQFGILPSEMEQAFSVLIAGGKAGKVELNDMASLTASLGAAFKQFKGSKGLDGVTNLGAIFQVAVRDFGTASEAATGLERLMAQIQAREFDLAKAGVKVRVGGKPGKGEFKSLMDIVAALDKFQSKDAKGFKEAFGNEINAQRTFRALRNGAKDVKALAVETRNANVVAQDFAEFQNSSSGKMAKSFNALKVAIAEVFTPERVARFAHAAGKVLGIVIETIERLESFLGDKNTLFSGTNVTTANMGKKAAVGLDRKGVDDISLNPFNGNNWKDIGRTLSGSNEFLLSEGMAASASQGTAYNAPTGNVFNIDIKSGDPKQVAAEIQSWWDRNMRSAAANTGGTTAP